jgi:hypothetical protein
MRRRALLATAGSALALSGCVSSPGTGDGAERSPAESPSPDDTSTPPATPALVEQSLAPRKDCETPGQAAVAFDSTAVRITGCIRGPNGCHVPVLESAAYDGASDRLRVVVGTESTADEETACTQAIVHRGYEVAVRFDGGLPGRAVVSHEGAGDRVEAARVVRTES